MINEVELKSIFSLCKLSNKWICLVAVEGSRICGTRLSHCGNTSIRTEHVRRKHPHIKMMSSKKSVASSTKATIPETAPPTNCQLLATTTTNTTTVANAPSFSSNSARCRIVNRAVVDFVVCCDLPLSIVDHPKFRALLKLLEPTFIPP